MAIAHLIVDLIVSITPAQIAGLLFLLGLYTLYGAIYRLFLSPISHIPGPKLAALTWWYEFYYDIILGGQYVFKMRSLHAQYGPIIRINPLEIHISDPDFFPVLYGANLRRDRWHFFTKQFDAPGSNIGTIPHDLHKLRRAALNPFFSQQSVRALQPEIESRVDALLSRLHSSASPAPINILYPYSAMTYDIICEYAFATSPSHLSHHTWGSDTTDCLLTGTHYGKLVQHCYHLFQIINLLPDFLTSALIPGWRAFLALKASIHSTLNTIAATQHTPRWELDVSHPTLYHALLSSPLLPPEEKSLGRLADEGRVAVQAGTLTVSWALTLATYYLLANPDILSRLKAELEEAIPDPTVSIPLAELEQLPFLRAVCKETLRHSFGASGRSARVCPEVLTYTTPDGKGSYTIPAGTPVGMTNYLTVTDPEIYVDPLGFNPDRWIVSGSNTKEEVARLERYLTVFSGGARACQGIWLAQAELVLGLAKVWRVWDGDGKGSGVGEKGLGGRMMLFETTERDVRMAADFFIPIPWSGSKGVRVLLERCE